jgi:tetratricopeptide (TPR) repeat protein
LCYFDADLALGLYSAIRSVNLAEQSGAPAALGRAYADMAIAMMVLGFTRASEWYCQKAEALIPRIDDHAARAWTHQLAGVYGSSMAQFDRGRTHLQQAIALAETIRDFRRQEESTFQRTLVSYQAGQFAEALQYAQTVHELAARYGHQQEQCWSTQLMALCLTRLGRVEAASDTANTVTPEQISQMGRTEQIMQYGAHALCHARAGRRSLAAQAAESGVATLKRVHPRVSFDLEGSASVIEALIELIAAEPAPDRRQKFLQLADLALPYLRAAARVFAVGRPRHALLLGAIAHAKGSDRAATAHFKNAIDLGASLQMPYEPALAHLYLARINGDLPEGKRHAAISTDMLAHLGADFDRARAEAVTRG